jgi:hypothetical protein
MLCHTICQLPGAGETTERRLWVRGLTTWEAALTGTAQQTQRPH